MRVLHVLGGMDTGGLEMWLMHVLRRIDGTRIHMDFLVHTSKPCTFDDEIRDLGSRVIPCLSPKNPLKYAHNFRNAVREYGPYDILHSHVHYYSGFVLLLGRHAGIPTLIAHSSTDTREHEGQNPVSRQTYVYIMKRLISHYADYGLAASITTAKDLFGSNWENDPRWRVLYGGIDLNQFRQDVNSSTIRIELGLSDTSFVVGHVGRFSKEKNHSFIVDIAREVAGDGKDIRFLLVGDGPLRHSIERKVRDLGLEEQFIFAGERADVPQLMLGAMDAFILPSWLEGLPTVLMEAQAAGLPCLISDFVTEETDIVKDLMRRLPIGVAPAIWSSKILELHGAKSNITQETAVSAVENSAFDIRKSIEGLVSLYERCA